MGTGRSEVLGGGAGEAGPGGHERSPVPVALVPPQTLPRRANARASNDSNAPQAEVTHQRALMRTQASGKEPGQGPPAAILLNPSNCVVHLAS
jgi:hypothetical protein